MAVRAKAQSGKGREGNGEKNGLPCCGLAALANHYLPAIRSFLLLCDFAPWATLRADIRSYHVARYAIAQWAGFQRQLPLMVGSHLPATQTASGVTVCMYRPGIQTQVPRHSQ